MAAASLCAPPEPVVCRCHRRYTRARTCHKRSRSAQPGSVYYRRACSPRNRQAPPEPAIHVRSRDAIVGKATLEVVIVAETVGKGTIGVKGGEKARTRTKDRERRRQKGGGEERERGKRKMLVAVIGYEAERRRREGGGQRCNHCDGDAGKGSEENGRPSTWWDRAGGCSRRERCIPGGEFPSPTFYSA